MCRKMFMCKQLWHTGSRHIIKEPSKKTFEQVYNLDGWPTWNISRCGLRWRNVGALDSRHCRKWAVGRQGLLVVPPEYSIIYMQKVWLESWTWKHKERRTKMCVYIGARHNVCVFECEWEGVSLSCSTSLAGACSASKIVLSHVNKKLRYHVLSLFVEKNRGTDSCIRWKNVWSSCQYFYLQQRKWENFHWQWFWEERAFEFKSPWFSDGNKFSSSCFPFLISLRSSSCLPKVSKKDLNSYYKRVNGEYSDYLPDHLEKVLSLLSWNSGGKEGSLQFCSAPGSDYGRVESLDKVAREVSGKFRLG